MRTVVIFISLEFDIDDQTDDFRKYRKSGKGEDVTWRLQIYFALSERLRRFNDYVSLSLVITWNGYFNVVNTNWINIRIEQRVRNGINRSCTRTSTRFTVFIIISSSFVIIRSGVNLFCVTCARTRLLKANALLF